MIGLILFLWLSIFFSVKLKFKWYGVLWQFKYFKRYKYKFINDTLMLLFIFVGNWFLSFDHSVRYFLRLFILCLIPFKIFGLFVYFNFVWLSPLYVDLTFLNDGGESLSNNVSIQCIILEYLKIFDKRYLKISFNQYSIHQLELKKLNLISAM